MLSAHPRPRIHVASSHPTSSRKTALAGASSSVQAGTRSIGRVAGAEGTEVDHRGQPAAAREQVAGQQVAVHPHGHPVVRRRGQRVLPGGGEASPRRCGRRARRGSRARRRPAPARGRRGRPASSRRPAARRCRGSRTGRRRTPRATGPRGPGRGRGPGSPPSSQRHTDQVNGYPSPGAPSATCSGTASGRYGASRGSQSRSSRACRSVWSSRGSRATRSSPRRYSAWMVADEVDRRDRQPCPRGELCRHQAAYEVDAGGLLVGVHHGSPLCWARNAGQPGFRPASQAGAPRGR